MKKNFKVITVLMAAAFIFTIVLAGNTAFARGGRRGGGRGMGGYSSSTSADGTVSSTGSGQGYGRRLRKRDGSGGNCSLSGTSNDTTVNAANWNTMRQGLGNGKRYGAANSSGRAMGAGAGAGRGLSADTSNMSADTQSAYQAFQDARTNFINLRQANASSEDVDAAYQNFISTRDAFKSAYSTETFSTTTTTTVDSE